MKTARQSVTGRGDVRLPSDDRFDTFRKATISLSDVGTPNSGVVFGETLPSDQPTIVIVGRMTAFDESTLTVKLYGEFQMHDMRTNERFQGPKLLLPASGVLVELMSDFAEDSGPLFFGLQLFEQQGLATWRMERFEL